MGIVFFRKTSSSECTLLSLYISVQHVIKSQAALKVNVHFCILPVFGKQLENNTGGKHGGEFIDTKDEELSNKELVELEEETNKDIEAEKEI